MRWMTTLALLLGLAGHVLCAGVAAAEGPEAAAAVENLIASESLSETQLLADTLSEFTLSEADVQRLIDAAEGTNSDPRRNVLWHALRYSRTRLGRDYLVKTIPAAETPLRIEFLQTLYNPAPFDVPLLAAIYESGNDQPTSDEQTLHETFLQFALGRWYETRTTRWHTTEDPKRYHSIGNRRGEDADAAQLRVMTYLVTNGHDLSARIAAFEYKGHPWYTGFEPEIRKRLAQQLLATAKTPAERSRLVSTLRREIPPATFLHGKEPQEVKLAAIAAVGEVVEDGWSSTAGYTYLRNAYRDLLPLARDEDEPELARAAAKLIKTMETKYGEQAPR